MKSLLSLFFDDCIHFFGFGTPPQLHILLSLGPLLFLEKEASFSRASMTHK